MVIWTNLKCTDGTRKFVTGAEFINTLGEGGTYKDKISQLNNSRHVFDFSYKIFLSKSFLEKSQYIEYVISTIQTNSVFLSVIVC